MNEFKEFQEIQERNNESLEARLEKQSQELLKKAYMPSFGKWSKYDSEIDYEIRQVNRDMKAGRKEAVKNGMDKIKDLQIKKGEEESEEK